MTAILSLFIICFGMSWSMQVQAQPVVNPEQTPRFLVHLLDYIALDYSGAVQNGKVISKSEYAEQLEFAHSALQTAAGLTTMKGHSGISANLSQLHQLISDRADVQAIRLLCRQIEGAVIKNAALEVAPSHWPNRQEGKQIYEKNCALCHGANGQGNGPSGRGLDPLPANFHDAKMAEVPPFQTFNAIRLGVPGTAMPSFPQYSDQEIWDLAFYLVGLRHEGSGKSETALKLPEGIELSQVATQSDQTLLTRLPGVEAEKKHLLSQIRLFTPRTEDANAFVSLAKQDLHAALVNFRAGKISEAKQNAVTAYLDGVEPIEPRLRVKDAALTFDLEAKMADVRSAIEARAELVVIESRIQIATQALSTAEAALKQKETSGWLTFTVAAGIFLREAFEAILILITLLGVLNSLGSKKASLYVHAGWMLAVVLGLVTWFFSGWLVNISGAQREILEGSISLLAVGVLLYFGFWLHRKTEIGKWRAFINEMVTSAVQEKNLIGLGTVAFMAVFREMFEVVLFLRVLLLESGGTQELPMALGVGLSFIVVVALATALVRFSARIPIRQLFSLSSVIMVLLSFILIGKSVHSFQETGWLPETAFPFPFQWDLIGIYPTFESLLPQLAILGMGFGLWFSGRRSSKLNQGGLSQG